MSHPTLSSTPACFTVRVARRSALAERAFVVVALLFVLRGGWHIANLARQAEAPKADLELVLNIIAVGIVVAVFRGAIRLIEALFEETWAVLGWKDHPATRSYPARVIHESGVLACAAPVVLLVLIELVGWSILDSAMKAGADPKTDPFCQNLGMFMGAAGAVLVVTVLFGAASLVRQTFEQIGARPAV